MIQVHETVLEIDYVKKKERMNEWEKERKKTDYAVNKNQNASSHEASRNERSILYS